MSTTSSFAALRLFHRSRRQPRASVPAGASSGIAPEHRFGPHWVVVRLPLRFIRRHASVVVVTLLWSLSLRWWEGETLWATHSPAFEPTRMIGVVDAWAHGIADARWFPSFDGGYGYPILSYHSPLFSWVGGTLLAVTGLPVLSLRLTVMVFFLTGALGSRAFAARYWGSRSNSDGHAGDLAVLGWASATYSMTNLFVRGSFAEFAASCFAPWVIHGLNLIGSDHRRYAKGAAVLAVSIALVVLSHNAIAVYMLLLLAGPLPLLLMPHGARGWSSLIAGGMFGALACAFFLVPAVLEKDWVGLDRVLVLQVHDHFLTISHFFAFSQWNLGLSGSGPAFTMPRHQGPLLPLAIGGACLSMFLLPKGDARRRTGILLGLALLTLALTLPLSAPLWDLLPLLQYTQFPWRWLSINTVMLAALLPAFDFALRARGENRSRGTYSLLVTATFLVSMALYGGPSQQWPRLQIDATPEALRAEVTRTALADEYGPIWRPLNFAHPVAADQALAENTTAVPLAGAPWRWSIGTRTATTRVTLGVHYFPGWKARWFENDLDTKAELPVASSDGLVQLTLPEGPSGTLVLEFTDTPLRAGLKVLSSGSLILGLAWLLAIRRRRLSAGPNEKGPADATRFGRPF
jgi:hypothetical protein